eukprot:scaffold1884_cov343-Ochromonas_danica.AAC.4
MHIILFNIRQTKYCTGVRKSGRSCFLDPPGLGEEKERVSCALFPALGLARKDPRGVFALPASGSQPQLN